MAVTSIPSDLERELADRIEGELAGAIEALMASREVVALPMQAQGFLRAALEHAVKALGVGPLVARILPYLVTRLLDDGRCTVDTGRIEWLDRR